MDEQAAAAPTTSAPLAVRNVPIIVVTAAVGLYVLHEGKPLFAPLLVSLLLAYALEPFVVALTRLRCPRVLAAVVIYVVLALAIASVTRVAGTQIAGFLDDLPRTVASVRKTAVAPPDGGMQPALVDRMRQAASDLHATIDAMSVPPESGVARVRPVSRGVAARDYLMNAGVTLAASGGRLLMIALLTFLLIVAGDLFKRKLIALAGPRRTDEKLTLEVIHTLDRQIERYLLVRLLISIIVATATGTAMWMSGLNHAMVWGMIAGVLNVLPFVGPSVACGLITAAAFLQFHAIEPTIMAGGTAVIIAALEGNLISPWLTSRAAELNTVAVFVSVLFWGWTWDVWGLALAVPITVAVKAAADHIEPLQPLGELLGR